MQCLIKLINQKKKKKTQNLISGVKLPDFAVCVLTNILLYI